MLVCLMMSHNTIRLCSFFKTYFSFCSWDQIISIDLSSFSLVLFSITSNLCLCYSNELFHFFYCTFYLQNFCLVIRIISISLQIVSIWWNIIFICSFNSLDMVFKVFLNIFIIVDLKFLLSVTSSFPQRQFLQGLFLLQYTGHNFLFCCMSHNFWWKINILNNIMWQLWKSNPPASLFVCLVTFLD